MTWFLYRCPSCGRCFISKLSDNEVILCVDCGNDIEYPTCMGIVGGVPEQKGADESGY